MKAEILKIAGVKSEKEFYKKFPTEEAFQKAHGKEFRKAKLGSAIPKAQPGIKKGSMEDIASKKQKCGLNDNDKQAGKEARALAKEPDAVVIPEWNEISNIENLGLDKKGRKALEKEYEAAKANYPGLDLPTYVAAVRDAGRTSTQFANPERAKYFDPKTGSLLPNVDTRSIDPYLRFYRGQFPTQSRIAPTDILNTFSNMPGGLSNYSKYANVGYVPPMQRQGGQTKKLKQLTSYEGDIDNIIPTAQVGTIQNLGLNSSASGVMPTTSSQQMMDMLTYKFPTSMPGGTAADQFAGINKEGTYTMDPRATGTLEEQIAKSSGAVDLSKSKDVAKGVGKSSNVVGKLGMEDLVGIGTDLIKGFQQLGEQRKLRKQTEQGKEVSALTLRASGTRPEQQRRMYVRPEDALIQPEQLTPSYGVGTNYLAKDGAVLKAQGGMQIGGNLTEIQNTYAPNTLYDDLGYEPLGESEIVKQYYGGGYVPKAEFGITDFMDAGGEDLVNKGIGAAFGGGSGGGTIGGALGKGIGTAIGGPVGGFIGGTLGKLAGNILDPNARKIKANQEAMQKNLQTAAMQSGAQALQGQYSTYVKHGGKIPHGEYGWVSHDWQPQVITHFGEHRVSDLLKRDPMMDTLRTGGNIRQNEMFPTDQFNFGGELQTTWGGYAEPISQNPYLPGTGQTVMFRGNSHEEADRKGRTGIGVKYGNDGEYSPYMEYGKDGVENVTDVEVERGEPAQEMIDPQTGEKNMVVFGNLKINKQSAGDIGDPKAAGKKFKNYVKDLSKTEARQNKIIEKASKKLDELEPFTPFDKLTLASLDAMQRGANMKLQKIAQKKTNASIVQNALNETAEELGVDADSLAKGKIKIDKEAMKQTAKYGKEIFKAQTGVTYPVYDADGKITSYVDDKGNPVTGSTIIPANQQTPPKRGQRRLVDNNSEVYDDATGKWISDAEYLKKYNLDGTPKQGAPKASTYTGSSIVDYLKSIGQPIDKASRKKLAESKGIKNYTGTIPQNEQLLKALRDEASKAQTAQPVAPTYTSKKGVPAMLNPASALGPFGGYDAPTDWARDLYDPNAPSPVDANAIQRVVPPYSPDYTGPYDPAAVAAFDRNAKAPAPTKEEKKKGKFDWITAANALIPYLRPTDQEPLDPNQLMGEMFALSANQLEPVPTQSVQYQLATPYDISYQDQLNEITAQARDAMRMAQGDPSALAAISAQANRAKSQVLGEQFRQNQAQRMGTYNQNLQTLKEQQLQNLGLYDKQYERQATARSKTKATAQEALSSISDKIQRNKLENRTLGVYENLYNYRFDPQGRAINYNPLAQFTAQVGDGGGRTTGGIAPGYEFTYDASGNIIGTRKSKKDEDTGRNGKIVRAIKNL